MVRQVGRKVFSLNYLFASFFGAFMIASAFAYFNYKFSEYKFIDFEELVFYEKGDVFTPSQDDYIVILYSSKMTPTQDLLKNLNPKEVVLAIDIFQERFESTPQVRYLTSSINTLLKFIQRFNVYEVPSVFLLKKHNGKLYKQDSSIEKLSI